MTGYNTSDIYGINHFIMETRSIGLFVWKRLYGGGAGMEQGTVWDWNVNKNYFKIMLYSTLLARVRTEAVMVDTWKGMEDLYKNNKVKNIGVSNFEPEHLEALLAQVSIKPVINQVEYHPYLTQHKLKLYLAAQHIVMESWSPLMNAQILNDETIKDIAQELGKSPAQVVLRWNVQHGVVTIPKSVTPNRISENFQIFDFELSDEQMTRIDGLNQDKRELDLIQNFLKARKQIGEF